MTRRAKSIRIARSPLRRVQAERQALLERLKSADGTPPGEGRPIEAMEVVQESVTRRVHAVSRQVLMARLRALQQAEERIRQGTYGLCEMCGDSIPARRLEAVPEARICVPCAEEAETRRHAFLPTVPR
jgi:RNA polymerase-binding transcription factor DksA